MSKQRYVRRSTFNFKEFDFLNANLLAAQKGGKIFIDIQRVCRSLKLSPSSQLARLHKHNIDITKMTFNKKVVRLISESDAQWWLDSFEKSLINTYAFRLIGEYQRNMLKEARHTFDSEQPASYQTEVIPVTNQRSLADVDAELMGITPSQETDLYKRLEENKKLRDEALQTFNEALQYVRQIQEKIEADVASINERMTLRLNPTDIFPDASV